MSRYELHEIGISLADHLTETHKLSGGSERSWRRAPGGWDVISAASNSAASASTIRCSAIGCRSPDGWSR